MTDPADETPLDRAVLAMEAAPEDDAARLRFHERLADAELFLLLAEDADGDHIAPQIFDTEDGRFLAAFDREDRLAAFAGGIAPYAALPGRGLAAMLAGQGIGLVLNPGTGAETLVAAEALDWLVGALAPRPDRTEARPRALHPPASLPAALVSALDAKLALLAGRAEAAWLAEAEHDTGTGDSHRTPLLVFVAAAPEAEPALAQAVAEALRFSGLDEGTLDIAFLPAGDPLTAVLARVGLRYDLPQPPAPALRRPPGSDPDAPPIQR
jgi:hypothetical protein